MVADLTDPNAVRALLESKNAVAYGGVPKPPAAPPNTPAPPFNPSFGAPQSNPVSSAPKYGVPATTPQKDMSGYKPQAPMFNPTPPPVSTPNSTGGVSGMLTPEQMKLYNSLPPEARAGFLNGGVPGVGMGTPKVGTAPSPAKDYSMIENTIRQNYLRDLEDKTKAITDALAQANQASNLGINQNNQQLQEQIKQLNEQKLANDETAKQFENRRGGFYSGGLDYQLGSNARANTEATSNAQRDVGNRNADITGRNALLAQQAADNIKQLQSAAPDRIREMIRQAVNEDRNFGLQEGQLTGNYGGGRTLAASSQDFNQGMANKQFGLDSQGQSFNQNLATQQYNQQAQNQQFNQGVTQAGLTGYYNPNSNQIQKMQANSAAWANASPAEKQRLAAENQKIGASIGAKQDANGDWIYPQGQRTMQGQAADNQAQQYGEEKAFREQRASVEDQKWLANYDRQGQQFAASQGLDWARLNQQQQQFIADQGYREQQTQQQSKERDFDRGVEVYKATGQMPSYMANYGIDVKGLSSPQYADDLNAMYQMLSSGQAKPQDMIKQIDDKVKIGAERPEDGERMKQAIFKLYPNLDPANKKPSSGENPMLSKSGENTFVNGDWLKRAAALGLWGLSKIAGQ